MGVAPILSGFHLMYNECQEKLTVKIEDVRKKYKDLAPQFVVDENGKRSMVLLRLDAFENLMEDFEDLAAFEERKNDAIITSKEMKARLKKSGHISD